MSFKNVGLSLQVNVKLSDILSLCYGISETELEILLMLMKSGTMTTDEIASKTGLSKAEVNRSLNKLVEAGFVMRLKEPGNRAGRPRYLYSVNVNLKEKIVNDVKSCFDEVIKLVERM